MLSRLFNAADISHRCPLALSCHSLTTVALLFVSVRMFY